MRSDIFAVHHFRTVQGKRTVQHQIHHTLRDDYDESCRAEVEDLARASVLDVLLPRIEQRARATCDGMSEREADSYVNGLVAQATRPGKILINLFEMDDQSPSHPVRLIDSWLM